MTDDEVLDHARTDGFELIERMSAGQWAVGWARGDDERRPCFLEERQAINWMRDRLRRGRVFVWGVERHLRAASPTLRNDEGRALHTHPASSCLCPARPRPARFGLPAGLGLTIRVGVVVPRRADILAGCPAVKVGGAMNLTDEAEVPVDVS
jgi:hypothetical protein